jgi:exonuclease SbcC
MSANRFRQTSNTAYIEKEYFDLFLPAADEYATYSVIENSIKEINKDLGDIGKVISDLNTSRNQVVEKFNQLRNTGHVSDKNCPLCDSAFESLNTLNAAINAKTNDLEGYSSEKLRQKARLEEQVKLFHARIAESVINFLTINSTTEQTVLALLREYPSLKSKIEELLESYPILDSATMESVYFIQPPAKETEIRERAIRLREILAGDLLPQLTYNEQLIDNRQLYSQYFDTDRNKFFSLSLEMLAAKLQYVLGSYSQIANSRLAFLEARGQKLSGLLERVSVVFDQAHRTIQDHKAEMIEKIKIPFYIYSGKILQSYQQGLGIFVQIHSTGQSNNVLFKTGHSSSHDIVYHLSSGQMAVVSLAFCLSLNKVYNTNEQFKFLSIDDPIQTMDDLNIHTFIELVRNEFKEYQIIMSTHDDFTSRYMKYKFDKFEMNTEIQNVQKIVIEQSIN